VLEAGKYWARRNRNQIAKIISLLCFDQIFITRIGKHFNQ
jgi:hypothetical protein